jgi:hypothetical protein
MGLWRYSMAALIVCAAMLDVIWWVPAHRDAERDRSAGAAQVQTELPQCRKARIQAEIDRLQAELDAIP